MATTNVTRAAGSAFLDDLGRALACPRVGALDAHDRDDGGRLVLVHDGLADLHDPSERDLAFEEKAKDRGWASVDDLDFNNLPTLPELIVGRAEGRKSDDEITCFMNNIGLGFQFAAAGVCIGPAARVVAGARFTAAIPGVPVGLCCTPLATGAGFCITGIDPALRCADRASRTSCPTTVQIKSPRTP